VHWAVWGDNRAGVEGTLHRISCIRNRRGDVVGLTCRAGPRRDGARGHGPRPAAHEQQPPLPRQVRPILLNLSATGFWNDKALKQYNMQE